MFRFVSEQARSIGTFVAKVLSPKSADTNRSGLECALSSSNHEAHNDNVIADSPKRVAKSEERTPGGSRGVSPPRLRSAEKRTRATRKPVKVASPNTPRLASRATSGGEGVETARSKSRRVQDAINEKGPMSEESNPEAPKEQREVRRVWKRKVLPRMESPLQPKASIVEKKRTSGSSPGRKVAAKRKAEVIDPTASAEAPPKRRPKSARKGAPGRECVGKRIKVLWEKGVVPGVEKDTWFIGKVMSYNPRKKLHGVRYDDGDFEEEDFGPMSSTRFHILDDV